MKERISSFLMQPRTVLAVYILIAVVAAVQMILLGTHPFVMPPAGTFPQDIMNKPELMSQFYGKQMTEYNNYLIFKNSWFHLLSGENLYGLFPDLHWDFYKYSPTFAFLMAPMAYLPDVVGMSIFDILNSLAVLWGIRLLPFKTKTQTLLLWFVAMELLTCLQNTQSNGLMCGLMILAYGHMERGKSIWATLCIVLAAYIKVYGAIAFLFWLFYPGKGKFILYAICWTLLLAALPLLVTSPATLLWQYQNWADLIKADAAAATGMSVAGWLRTWFGINNVKSIVSLIGLVLFAAPFVRFKMYKNEVFQILTLASMLLWVVIFNHKAESPTFIIAVAGAGIWYYAMPAARWRLVVMLLVLVFTSFSTTDLFPPFVRQHFIYPYTIKAVPCIIAWVIVFVELLLLKPNAKIARTTTQHA